MEKLSPGSEPVVASADPERNAMSIAMGLKPGRMDPSPVELELELTLAYAVAAAATAGVVAVRGRQRANPRASQDPDR
jgi:hypothetical protein